MAELYAIAGDMERARFMLRAGAPYLQLRFKNEPLVPWREEISGWCAAFPETRLVINDDLGFAEQVGAWGVHLGQEDLLRYSPERLAGAAPRLGVSTHSDEEIAKARKISPAMLGYGPVFPTSSKETKRPPRGVERLRHVVETVPLPIVAIGGIDGSNLDNVVETGVAMVAMIAYLDQFETPAQLQSLIARMRG